MMRLGSFATGVFALAALEVVTSSPGAAGRTATLPTIAAGVARRLLDPNIALLPNWHDDHAPKRGDPANFDAGGGGAFDGSGASWGSAPTGAGRSPVVAPAPTSSADVLRHTHGPKAGP